MVEIHKPPNVKVIDKIWVGMSKNRGWQEWGPKTEPRRSKEVNQSRWLLSLAAVRDGMNRGEAAKIGGMDRRTLHATGLTVSTPLGRMGSSTTGRMVRRKRRRPMMTFAALVVAAIHSVANRRKRQTPPALIDFLGPPGSVVGAHSRHSRLRTRQPKSHR